MKNFHVPLPEQPYLSLSAEEVRKARHDAIAAYAAEMAGTLFDLDADLESAGIEHMLNTSKVIR